MVMSSAEIVDALRQDPALRAEVLQALLPGRDAVARTIRAAIRSAWRKWRNGPFVDIGEPAAYDAASAVLKAAGLP